MYLFPSHPNTNSCLTSTFSLQFLRLCFGLWKFLRLWFEKAEFNEAQKTSPAAVNSKNKQRLRSNPTHHPLNNLHLKSIHIHLHANTARTKVLCGKQGGDVWLKEWMMNKSIPTFMLTKSFLEDRPDKHQTNNSKPQSCHSSNCNGHCPLCVLPCPYI